ncbi:hypothetical protein [Aeromicrobium sp.]
MIGWFIAAETSECDGCGHRIKRNGRVFYFTADDGNGAEIEQRHCVECAP